MKIDEIELRAYLKLKPVKSLARARNAHTKATYWQLDLKWRCFRARDEFTHNPTNPTGFIKSPSDCGIVENSTY